MSKTVLTFNKKMANLNRSPRSRIFIDSDIENSHQLIIEVAVDAMKILLAQNRQVKQIAKNQKTRANWVLTENISPNGGDLRLKGFDYRKGDFRRIGGTILGALRLSFGGDTSQIFQPGTDEIALWDLFHFCELTLNADAILNTSLSNSSPSILAAKAHLQGATANIYKNFSTIAENSQIRHNAEVLFADNQIARVLLSISKDELYVTLVNEERNLNGNAMETNRVTPKSTNALEEGTLTMTQTDNSGAPLRASLPAVMDCAQWGNDALERNLAKSEGSCPKSEAFAIASNGHRQTAAIIWTGKGADSYWSNPLNWSGDRAPTEGDRVVFEGPSTKNVILNICPQIKSLTITSGYTGTLSGWNDLMVSENVLIQGGTINVNLEIEGDLSIENGTVNSYLSVGGNLAICNGIVDWSGGKVGGNVTLSGGVVSFSSNYNSYYLLDGNFTQAGATISGQPIFCFQGNRVQTFEPGEGGMTLRDLYNFSELILNGEVTLSGIFCNNGTLTVVNAATLDARKVNFFSNSGAIALQGKILPKEPVAKAETDDNCSTFDPSENPLYINSIKEGKDFDSPAKETAQIAIKSLRGLGEGTYASAQPDKSSPSFKGKLATAMGAANTGENGRDREGTEELKVKCTDTETRSDPTLHHFQTAAIV